MNIKKDRKKFCKKIRCWKIKKQENRNKNVKVLEFKEKKVKVLEFKDNN